MAENKKSFVLYCDLIHTIEKLPDDKAGLLFKHLLRYVNDQNPITDDLLVEIAFEPIRHQLKRDLSKWDTKIDKLTEQGRLGGIKSGEARALKKKQNEANASKNEANEAVTVNVTVNDTVNVNVNDINISFDVFWNLYNKKINSKDCESKWNKLKDIDRQKIIDTLPNFLNSITDKQYQPHPITYLNQKRWNDEQSNTIKKEYELYSQNGTIKMNLTEIELIEKKKTGFYKEKHEI
jgi:hypothetical protein